MEYEKGQLPIVAHFAGVEKPSSILTLEHPKGTPTYAQAGPAFWETRPCQLCIPAELAAFGALDLLWKEMLP